MMKIRALVVTILLCSTTTLLAASQITVGKKYIAFGPYTGTFTPNELTLISNEGRLLFVWTEMTNGQQRIFTAPYRAFGTIDRRSIMTVPASELGQPRDVTAPAIAREADGFRATWIERHGARIAYVTAHVAADGRTGTPTILRQTLPSDDTPPRITPSGSNFVLVSGTLQSLIDGNGRTIDLASIGVPGARTMATSVASNNGDVMVLAQSTTPAFCIAFGGFGFPRIVCTPAQDRLEMLVGGGSKLPTLRSAKASPQVEDNALALGGGKAGFLGVWREGRGSALRVPLVAMRFTSKGDAIDANGINLGEVSRNRGMPVAIEYDGENWLLVWEDNDQLRGTLYAQLISPSGEVRSPEAPLTLTLASESAHSPSLLQVAPGRFLLAYRENGATGSNIVVRELLTREQERARPTRH